MLGEIHLGHSLCWDVPYAMPAFATSVACCSRGELHKALGATLLILSSFVFPPVLSNIPCLFLSLFVKIPITMSLNKIIAGLGLLAAATASPMGLNSRDFTSSSCTGGNAQPLGSGPVSYPDTAAAFVANAKYAQVAMAAKTPSGYTQMFSNLNGSVSGSGYLTYTTIGSYDPSSCATQCNSITGCQSFDIYYERDPTVTPGTGTGCDNPSSTTLIKCAFWSVSIHASDATNTGQWQDKFQVVIAGSNGYTIGGNQPAPDSYMAPVFLNNASINAPTDSGSYMGYKLFSGAPFDIAQCAAACDAVSEANLANPPATGDAQTCDFVNTYLLYKNGVSQGQVCAFYSQEWSQDYAVNNGYYSGADHYTIGMSYSVAKQSSSC